MDPHAAALLLDRLQKLPRRVERPRTFMEIGGYAHSENVCSNLLAFFFDPGAPHGLGSLFLDALLDSSDSAGDARRDGRIDHFFGNQFFCLQVTISSARTASR